MWTHISHRQDFLLVSVCREDFFCLHDNDNKGENRSSKANKRRRKSFSKTFKILKTIVNLLRFPPSSDNSLHIKQFEKFNKQKKSCGWLKISEKNRWRQKICNWISKQSLGSQKGKWIKHFYYSVKFADMNSSNRIQCKFSINQKLSIARIEEF